MICYNVFCRYKCEWHHNRYGLVRNNRDNNIIGNRPVHAILLFVDVLIVTGLVEAPAEAWHVQDLYVCVPYAAVSMMQCCLVLRCQWGDRVPAGWASGNERERTYMPYP